MRIPLMVALVVLAGCRFGRVNQGRVIEYQRSQGLITLISDSNPLPPITIRTPEDPNEMGPEPEAGKLLLLDSANRRVMIFDSATQRLRTIPYTLVSERGDVRSTDPSVSRTRFPVVDRASRAITVYSPRDRKLVTFSVAEEYFALPDDTWKAGDEIRYYYKDPGRALRLMNVSKTDLNTGGK